MEIGLEGKECFDYSTKTPKKYELDNALCLVSQGQLWIEVQFHVLFLVEFTPFPEVIIKLSPKIPLPNQNVYQELTQGNSYIGITTFGYLVAQGDEWRLSKDETFGGIILYRV
jgi:hypothetical protein